MPRYYFHIHNGIGHTPDEEGQELADVGQARAKAVDGARSLMSEEMLHGELDLDGRIDVFDEKGSRIISVGFAEAVRISGLNGATSGPPDA